jgi:hypothetical protein
MAKFIPRRYARDQRVARDIENRVFGDEFFQRYFSIIAPVSLLGLVPPNRLPAPGKSNSDKQLRHARLVVRMLWITMQSNTFCPFSFQKNQKMTVCAHCVPQLKLAA